MPPRTNLTTFATDRLRNPNFDFASELEETPVADATTPEDVAAQPAPAQVQESGFQVQIPNTVQSTDLDPNVTLESVRRELQRRRGAETGAASLRDFDPNVSEPTVFNDPEQFILSTLYGDNEMSQAKRRQEEILGDVADTTGQIEQRLTSTRERAEETTQIGARQDALAETNERIAQRQARFRRELRAFEEDPEGRTISRAFRQDQKAKLEADATAELADLYIIQNAQQGNVQAAREYIDTAVNNRYRSIEIELRQKQAELDALIPTLQAEEKREAQQLQLAINERANNIETEKQEAKNKRSYMLEVASMGAPDDLQQRILNAPTEDQAALLTSQYIGRQMRAQAAASAAGTGGLKAPTIKTINGVDYQWNEILGIWESPTGTGGGAESVASAKDNLTFLRNTTARILGTGEFEGDGLYKGAGQAVLSQKIGRLFRGQTATTRLEAQVDTLRSNMLTLATDPSIKEFFGPQMSDADVRLMTAAGTTLRPDSQTPEELRAEAQRIDDLLNRMMTSLPDEQSQRNLITAPDGTLVEIVE